VRLRFQNLQQGSIQEEKNREFPGAACELMLCVSVVTIRYIREIAV